MRIIVNFLSGVSYWEDIVTTSADIASKALSDPAFLAKIASQPRFDFCHETSGQVANKIQLAGEVKISVGFYSKWLTYAIAYEQDGAVFFNTRKERYGAGSPGNVAHEVMHALGYQHNGNNASGNQGTVPYKIGSWVQDWVMPDSLPSSSFQLA